MFTVLFNDLSLAYVNGTLFRDDALVGGGKMFLRHLIANPSLGAATSEKGSFANGQAEFSQGSVFRAVVDSVRVRTCSSAAISATSGPILSASRLRRPRRRSASITPSRRSFVERIRLS